MRELFWRPVAKDQSTSQARKESTTINFLGPETTGGEGLPRAAVVVEKPVPSPRKFFFLGFGREELGISREFCRNIPDAWGLSKSGQEKNINIFGGTVCGTNRNRSWDKPGPVPGTNRPFSVELHSTIAILSRLSLGRVGDRPWDDCPANAVRKMFMCFLFIGCFRLPNTVLLPPKRSLALRSKRPARK